METRDEGVFGHDEVMVSYVLKAAENGRRARVLIVITQTCLFYWCIGCIGQI